VPPRGEETAGVADNTQVYRQLSRIADKDALHSLIAKHGPEILEKGLPYVLIAVRNWQRSAFRARTAHREVAADEAPEPSSIWDPVEELYHKKSLQQLAVALGELDDEDALVLWRHAEGYSDAEIRKEWDKLGLSPQNPAEEYLRKRRQRARERLRNILVGRITK
jgi:hypothetical protein